MNGPPRAGSTARALQAQGLDTERTSALPRRAGAGEPGRGHPGKPVGAVVAAANVLRTLHASERPLKASEVARAAGLHRGTAYNILRTLQAEGFVGYDEATRSYAVSLHILALAYGVLRRSGLMDLARPLMDAVSDAHGVSVYLSKVLGPSARVPHRSLRHRRAAVPWPGRGLLSGVGFLREAREKCLSTGHYLSQALDFIEMVSGLP